MKKYNQPGDVHFSTFRTYKSYPFFKDENCCIIFLKNLEFYRQRYDLKIYGYAILLEHIHQMMRFDMVKYPQLTISKIIQDFKSSVARQIIDYYKSAAARKAGSQEPLLLARIKDYSMEQELHATHRVNKNHKLGLKYRVWQHGFYDFNIYTTKKFYEKLNYIHYNPIKHGLTDNISKYKYCSWKNYELGDHSIFKIDYPED